MGERLIILYYNVKKKFKIIFSIIDKQYVHIPFPKKNIYVRVSKVVNNTDNISKV